jgi:hypothetical protein
LHDDVRLDLRLAIRKPKFVVAMSSPGGEETGEGERQNKLHPLPDYTKSMTERKS